MLVLKQKLLLVRKALRRNKGSIFEDESSLKPFYNVNDNVTIIAISFLNVLKLR